MAGASTGPKKVLVLVAHPRRGSYCEALAAAYAQGARAGGCEVRECHLADLRFDPDVHGESPSEQPLEPDLQRAWDDIVWADHLFIVLPGWWGTGPARLKGFLDRVLLPGKAFQETVDGRYQGLLGGRTAHVALTIDMPPWVYRWIYKAPGVMALQRSTLGLCGITTTRVLKFGPIKHSSPAQREQWLAQCRALGESLRDGPRGAVARRAHRAAIWMQALRLQFYPMSWMAYTVGALIAPAVGLRWHFGPYLAGYACLFLIKAATVFTNERIDLPSDRLNAHAGPFNGGSRVLVDGKLDEAALQRAARLALALALLIALPLVAVNPAPLRVAAALALLAVLALGYSASPLRLSWRGWGEFDVALTHSIGAMGWGLLVQGGSLAEPMLWALGVPLGFAILPAIILSGVPDRQADAAAGKRTLAVRWGPLRARDAALGAALAAVGALQWWQHDAAALRTTSGLMPWIAAHTLLLGWLLYRRGALRDGRIDVVLIVALTLMLWFVTPPLLRLM